MTLHTAVNACNNRVPVLGILDDLLYILVTWVTKLRRRGFDHLGVGGPVRVVAANAVIFRRLMDEFVFLQFITSHYMAGKAKL